MNNVIKPIGPGLWRSLLAAGLAALLLSACENAPVHNVGIYTAASGTKVEAQQVVSLIYKQESLDGISQLAYSGGDLSRAIKRSYNRFPELRPHFEQGTIGNTASGFVALRDSAQKDVLKQLLRAENTDRAYIYTQTSVAVGQGNDMISTWEKYASFAFGQEWIAQAPAGWWAQDQKGNWTSR
jgi:hypothetical protein